MERLTNTNKRATKAQLYERLAELEDRLENGQIVDTADKVGKYIEAMEFDYAMQEYMQFVSAFAMIASMGTISHKKMMETMQRFCEILRGRLFGKVEIIDNDKN